MSRNRRHVNPEAVYREIVRSWAEDGLPPTVDMLSANLGISRATVYKRIYQLAERGRLDISRGISRGLKLTGSIWQPPKEWRENDN